MRKTIYIILFWSLTAQLLAESAAPLENSGEKAYPSTLVTEECESASEAEANGKAMRMDLGKGVELEITFLRGGDFSMGSPSDEGGRVANEGPVHKVLLSDFWIGKYEVTQEQYGALMAKNPSQPTGKDQPIDHVSWLDAMEFCKRLSEKSGSSFTLPTEAQWEYACRAGNGTKYCFPDSEGKLDDYAWYEPNSRGITHVVGEKSPNPWGLYDMHGNVMEWCKDSYGAYERPAILCKNPINKKKCSYRVLRGGSWGLGANGCRSAFRSLHTPEFHDNDIGFRVVMLSVGS